MKPAFLEYRMTLVVVLVLLMYFLWMDVALYCQIQNWHPMLLPTAAHQDDVKTPPSELFSPFTGLSVKMMMMDQVNNYIHTPTAQLFNKVTNFSESLYFITPNMISFAGLLFAIAAAKCVSLDSLLMHRVAVILFQLRTWFDALDGMVARSRIGMVQHMSLRYTSGYVVDGLADTLGFAAFLIGCLVFLQHTLPKQKDYLPLSLGEKSGKNGMSNRSSQLPGRRITFMVACFGIQLAISGFFWDHYIDTYHRLLEVPNSSASQSAVQVEVLQSSLTWIIMWFWRISNAHSFIQMLLLAVFINRLREFLSWIQYIGFVELFILIAFTEVHLHDVQTYLGRIS